MPTDYERPGNAPTTAALCSALATIQQAVRSARHDRGYREGLGRETCKRLLIDVLDLSLAAGDRVALAETILGPAITACIGPSYMSDYLAYGSLGSEGREVAREWAEGRPPADECFRRLLRANAAAFQSPGSRLKRQIEAEAADVLCSREELEVRKRADAGLRAAKLEASHRRRGRRGGPRAVNGGSEK
ncbi:hypothetical protein [Paracoccus sp. SJTW-4]|uniref:hypothetical protein n=1 Tax=Paracoccus sp. SJTW-4 TaxID=3078428 RepID=UPI0039EABBD0